MFKKLSFFTVGIFVLALVFFFTNTTCLSAEKKRKKRKRNIPQPTKKVIYKTIGDVKLRIHIFEPTGHKSSDKRPVIVFFFGGGWVGGSPSQFYPQCAYLASRGMVAMSAEYRVKKRHKTTPFECVKDGKSAIRWVRNHATKLGIDPNKVAAGGGSAGGHVAAAVGTVTGLNEDGEATSTSCVPNALVLFNPVYDNGPGGWGYRQVKDRYKEISPMHNIRKGMPPTITFLGTNDRLIPVATAKKFQQKMRDVGSKSELKLYEGAGHGFFNFGRGGGNAYRKTTKQMDEFLIALGFLEGKPTIRNDD